jgi:hypothetical protein
MADNIKDHAPNDILLQCISYLYNHENMTNNNNSRIYDFFMTVWNHHYVSCVEWLILQNHWNNYMDVFDINLLENIININSVHCFTNNFYIDILWKQHPYE